MKGMCENEQVRFAEIDGVKVIQETRYVVENGEVKVTTISWHRYKTDKQREIILGDNPICTYPKSSLIDAYEENDKWLRDKFGVDN